MLTRHAFRARWEYAALVVIAIEATVPPWPADHVLAAPRAFAQSGAEVEKADPRLDRKVTLQLKGAPFERLCEALREASEISFHAGRGVQDEKVTVFVKERPLRDVMRAVARLFDYRWARSGEGGWVGSGSGKYRYELRQDLRSQLAEEELRRRDFHAALLEIDRQMEGFGDYLGLSEEELAGRMRGAEEGERKRLEQMLFGGWGGTQLYRRLTPTERSALASGGEVAVSTDAGQAGRLLPEAWRARLLSQAASDSIAYALDERGNVAAGTVEELQRRGLTSTRMAEIPNPKLSVSLKMDRSELGEVSLESQTRVTVTFGGRELGSSSPRVLARGKSPSVAKPDNAAANRALKNDPAFRRVVSLRPGTSCARLVREAGKEPTVGNPGIRLEDGVEKRYVAQIPLSRWEANLDDAPAPPLPHLSSADVWEEVHRRTGLPVVADYYTQLHKPEAVTVERQPLFDALCQVGDTLGMRWRKDGREPDAIVLCRSTGYFWDKLKEVPERSLARWQEHRARNGGLPFDDLLEMALLPDAALDSKLIWQGVVHCRELREWGLVHKGRDSSMEFMRPWARLLAGLPTDQRRGLFLPGGIPFVALPVEQQEEAVRLASRRIRGTPAEARQQLASSRLRVEYVPAGGFAWHPWVTGPDRERVVRITSVAPVVWGRTREAALAAARNVYPGAAPDEVRQRTEGIFVVTFLYADGKAAVFGARPLTAGKG